jgi:hypothetical protein
MPFDDYNLPVTGDIGWWVWREWYYTINVCNFGLSRTGDDNSALSDRLKDIKGQLLFPAWSGLLQPGGYFQNPPLITDYSTYSTSMASMPRTTASTR